MLLLLGKDLLPTNSLGQTETGLRFKVSFDRPESAGGRLIESKEETNLLDGQLHMMIEVDDFIFVFCYTNMFIIIAILLLL